VASGVIVAISGGVDSSMAAALLIQQGYSVTGVMLRLWQDIGYEREGDLAENLRDAQAIAERLRIQLHIIDRTDLFKQKVIDPFVQSYLSGETPNPCVDCNPVVKWNVLLDCMARFGADYIATGHYARVLRTNNGKIQLLKGVDENKDQSYVLCHLTQDLLKHTLLPVGTYSKRDVRAMANELGLITAKRKTVRIYVFLIKQIPDIL